MNWNKFKSMSIFQKTQWIIQYYSLTIIVMVVLDGECDISSYMESDLNQKQAFTVRLLADELDIVIAPKKEMQELQQNGYLKRMEVIHQDSFYYSVTRDKEAQFDHEMYVGETVKSKNSISIDAVISYIQMRR